MVAMLAALALGAAYALPVLVGGVDFRAMEQHRSDGDTSGLSASLVAQSFQSLRDNLSLIEIELGSFVGLPDGGRVRLLSGEGLGGEVVYEAPLSAAGFTKNPYLSVRFPPIAGSAGVTYTLVLETPGRPLSTALGVRYSSYDTLSSGRMFLQPGEEEPEWDVAFATYYHYDLWTLLGDVQSALTDQGMLPFSWLALLVLPGLALLLWLPNSLSGQQRLLAAPGLSALALPIFLLVTRSLGLRLGGAAMWVLLAVCAGAILLWWTRHRGTAARPVITLPDVAFWAALAGTMFLTVSGRLLSLRDAEAGMGIDAYHHTLIAQMIVTQGGIPPDYSPFYGSLASFTYHYGFHSLVAGVGWLAGRTSPTEIMALMPQAGQIGTTLPVLTLALFAWRVLGNRWAGLAAGTLAGVVCIFPAFYVNWSRYTQGLGLALLPLAWVLLIDALTWPAKKIDAPVGPVTWRRAAEQSGPFMLAVVGAAGLALTHYRIAMIYAVFAFFYLLWVGMSGMSGVRQRTPRAEVLRPLGRALAVGVLTLAALGPWLVNLAQNFGSRFVGKDSPVAARYYSLENMGLNPLLAHPSLAVIFALSFGGLVWAVRRRDPLPLLPALTWLALGLWSNPYLLPFRLPYSGYLDATTLATGIWLPLCLMAGYTVARFAGWFLGLGDSYAGWGRRAWRVAAPAALAITALLVGSATGLSLAPMTDTKPYISKADAEALAWMRENLPRYAYVLANPFAFPWDAPPQAIQGSDAGLWVPLLSGVRASVPPIPAYNERLRDPDYLNRLREIVPLEPFAEQMEKPPEMSQEEWDAKQQEMWQALKDEGITHIYVGSRGGALSVSHLLRSDRVRLIFHKDAAWVFEVVE